MIHLEGAEVGLYDTGDDKTIEVWAEPKRRNLEITSSSSITEVTAILIKKQSSPAIW